jgi:hypothetical protein
MQKLDHIFTSMDRPSNVTVRPDAAPAIPHVEGASRGAHPRAWRETDAQRPLSVTPLRAIRMPPSF